jgi:hypothetical protein
VSIALATRDQVVGDASLAFLEAAFAFLWSRGEGGGGFNIVDR